MSAGESLTHCAGPEPNVYRHQLQHLLLEIHRRFGLREVFIIGSAAILAVLPNPPIGELTATRDADVVPPQDEERLADQISFVIGEASDFDAEYGYYAQGVTSRTPTYAPRDWKSRAIPLTVGEMTGRCMEPHDLVLSKLGAAREKDLPFARSVAQLDLVRREPLIERLELIECSDEDRKRLAARVEALFT
jgi:hypothetical protein